jgi:hypothetical protein
MILNMHVCRNLGTWVGQQSRSLTVLQMKDAVGNDYGRPRDVVGENRYAFTTHADSAFDVCFENIIPDSKRGSFAVFET